MALSKKDLDKFHQQLLQLKMQITHSLQGATQDVKRPDEATGYSQHQADQGTDDFDRTISIEVTGKEFEVLKQIDRALEKIANNTYGICDMTGEEIPKARLEAIPYAIMTVKAQEQFEKGVL